MSDYYTIHKIADVLKIFSIISFALILLKKDMFAKLKFEPYQNI